MSGHHTANRVGLAALVCALALTLGIAGCAPRTDDVPEFRLTDDGSIELLARITGGSEPASLQDGDSFAYTAQGSPSSAMTVERYSVSAEESQTIANGDLLSACATGVYYADGDSLYFLGSDQSQPTPFEMSGYNYMLASPSGTRMLLGKSPEDTTFSIRNVSTDVTTPLAKGDKDATRPSWLGDDMLIVDAVSDDPAADRAVYALAVTPTETVVYTPVKLGVIEGSVTATDGLLVCLETDLDTAGGAKMIAVYDLESRERVAVVNGEDNTETYGDLVWISDDTFVAELDIKDGGTDLLVFRVKR